MLLATACASFSRNMEKKLANTRNGNFRENGQKLARERYRNSVFSIFGIVVPYKRAEFGSDRFGNDKATTFFRFCMSPCGDDFAYPTEKVDKRSRYD